MPAMTLEQIAEVLAKHKKWVFGEEGGERANLSGADLSGAYLSRAYLSGANLSGADLSRAYLSGADLSRANLSGADLSRAYLSGADLSRANLSGANLSGADLSGAYLSGAYLSGAYLNWTSHDVVSQLLFREAKGDIERERWAGWILLRRDLCWEGFLKAIPADQIAWGLAALAPYVKDGDNAPEALRKAARERTEAA
jgi:hypothetical protein